LEAKWAKDFGPALVFRRLWEKLELDRILRDLLAGTEISIDLEEAIFAMVLNRLSKYRLHFLRGSGKIFPRSKVREAVRDRWESRRIVWSST